MTFDECERVAKHPVLLGYIVGTAEQSGALFADNGTLNFSICLVH
ncbi:MAG: hypothetical protein JWM91_786 [Rhodospirillales bacterium]|nr:hypothetical protein [Rhodospirillales bacterium]